MGVLVVADHDNAALKAATLNAVTAAAAIGGEVAVLVAGHNCSGAAQAAAKVKGVAKVLVADDPAYANLLAENTAPLIAREAQKHGHVVAPATSNGKNLMPRVAALLDVQQISDIVAVKSPDTFVRPIYAGNALATVQSTDKIKVVTVRGTAFEPAPAEGGSAPIEKLAAEKDAGLSRFLGQALSRTERPELTSARIVISAGAACRTARTSRSTSSRWPTGWARPWAPRARRSTPGSCPTTTRSARPARSSPPTSMWRWASPARSSISPA
jgi:electron transfer flavoprotein alpha subunit